MFRICAMQKWRIFWSFIVLLTVIASTDCCSSRVIFMTDTTPSKMQPKIFSKDADARDTSSRQGDPPPYRILENEEDHRLIHLIMFTECSSIFNLYYCLNGGRCFNYTIANASTPSCECSEGFFGERCESKYFITSDTYPRKISMAKIYIGSFLAGFLGSVLVYGCCIAILHC